ncbi:MAG: PorP/SprF family type IX secretion system membrane protein, partial [Cytophagaceae bacterium]
MRIDIKLFFGLFLLILFLAVQEGVSQDVQFSQFYNVPLHLNPGFAGSSHQTRGTIHHRFQWPTLDARYTTSMASVDTYFPEYKSGVGLMVLQDYQGGNEFSSTDVVLQYSYEVHISSNITFRPGLQIGYVTRSLDYSRLTFPQQFNHLGQQDFSNPYGLGFRRHYADIGSGGIVYSKDFWFGFAAHHLNMPNQSFLGDVSRLPVKYSFVSGYKIRLNKKQKYMSYLQEEREFCIIPTLHYKFQGPSDQFDIGLYGIYDMLI